jgi:hypothetical protein
MVALEVEEVLEDVAVKVGTEIQLAKTSLTVSAVLAMVPLEGVEGMAAKVATVATVERSH